MTPTTRYLCPLCDWHHDETTPDFGNPNAVHPFVQQDWAPGIDGLVAELAAGQTAVVETAVKAHLETHPLIEWVRALQEARTERDELQARIDAVDWPALHAVVAAEGERRQRYDRHSAGRCPMCGDEGTGGWICEADMEMVRPMRGPERRAWRRFERPRGEPIQGSGYTTGDLLGAPLRTPATQAKPSAWPEDGSVPWGGNGEDCPRCSGTNLPYPFICPGHPAEGPPLPTQATNLSLAPPPEFIVRLGGFEILRNEIAAEAGTLDRLRAWLATQDPWAVGCVTSLFRFAADPELPVGEVHMRRTKGAPADVAGPATQASGPQFTGGPVEMPTVDYAGQKWWRGKPWPPRDETGGCER